MLHPKQAPGGQVVGETTALQEIAQRPSDDQLVVVAEGPTLQLEVVHDDAQVPLVV
jgi:hypothetical protein